MKVKAIIENQNLELEEIIVNIDARDRRAFERDGRREFGIPASINLPDAVKGIPESYIGWLVWHSLTRSNNRKDITDWKSFESRLIQTESLEDEEELDFPT